MNELTQLGHESRIPAGPEAAVLETVANPHAGTLFLARFTARNSPRCVR